MSNFDSGRGHNIGGFNIRQRRGSDLGAIRFDADIATAPTSTNDMLLYRRSSGLRFWDGTTEYNLLTSVSGSVGDLNGVYENGRTITVDEGAVIWNDATAGAANLMEFNKTGAGSGNILDFDFTAAFTGSVLNLDMGSAVGATGIVIDSEGGSRTGADLLFTDDSAAAHICIDINASGNAARTGLDWTDSFSGSPAAFGIVLTTGNGNGLDSTPLRIVRGTGVRTVPAIDINEGSTGSANVVDIDVTAAYTGNVLDIVTSAAATGNAIFINMDSAVAMTAIHIEGSGTRTQPAFEMHSDATGAVSLFEVLLTGATSGHVFEISLDTTSTGDVLNVDMNASVGGRFLFLDGGAAIRTANLIDVTNDGSGNTDIMEVSDSNTGSGHLIDINTSGIGSGNVLDITYSAADTGDALSVVMADNVAGGALVITGAGARTDSLIDVVSSETGSMDGMVLLQTTGVFTGHMLTVHSDAAATTGGLVHLDLDAGVAYKALTIDLAGARTAEVALVTFDGTFGSGAGGTFLNLDVTMTGAGASPLFDIDVTGVYTGNIFDVVFGNASASTGHALHVDMGTNLAGNAVLIDAAGARTAPLIYIANTGTDGGTDDHVLFINQTGLLNSNLIQLTFGTAASDGEAIAISMGTNLAGSALTVNGTGARTDDLIKIDDDSSGNSHIFDINLTGVYTGNVLDISFATLAATGEAINIAMGTNVAGSAIVLNGTGIRTDDLIKIDDDSTGNSHIFDINMTGIYTGNILDITFSVAAATSDAVLLAMGTNVEGRAIAVTSAGTGVSDEGSVLDITHSGILVAGADIVNITSSGAISSTSNALAIEPAAGDAGSYALYINAGGSCEGIKVDAGTVVVDESVSIGTTLTVTGATTLSSTLSFRDLTEVVVDANTILAAESGSVFFLNDATTEFDSELPAPAAGLHFTFVVQAAPSGANYTVSTASSANIILGTVHSSDGVDGDSELSGCDTINFVDGAAVVGDRVELWCNGTNWFAIAHCNVSTGITFTTAT